MQLELWPNTSAASSPTKSSPTKFSTMQHLRLRRRSSSWRLQLLSSQHKRTRYFKREWASFKSISSQGITLCFWLWDQWILMLAKGEKFTQSLRHMKEYLATCYICIDCRRISSSLKHWGSLWLRRPCDSWLLDSILGLAMIFLIML